MSIANVSGKVRATRGEFLRLRKRLEFLREGLEVLTMKRDQLNQDLQEAMGHMSTYKSELEKELMEAFEGLITAYTTLGRSEIETQAESVQGTLKVRVKTKSVMGTLVPKIDIVSRPNLKGKIGTVQYGVANRFLNLLDNLITEAEMENEILRVAYELHKTNSKVNALEKAVIPEQEAEIKFIEEKLEEEALEDLSRMKIIKNAIIRRRS